MKFRELTGLGAALLLSASVAQAEAPTLGPQVGDSYEITLTKESSQRGSNGSSGSSHDQDTTIERVIGLRADGLELQYDLPNSATADDRARSWQFPARVFWPFDGPPLLLNAPELKARLDAWLKAAKLPRTACGHWIFTWNAFRIECDPQSVLKALEPIDLRSADIREGAPFRDANALGTGSLVKVAKPDGVIFTVDMQVNPDAIRRTDAESDVVVGEIMNRPVTLDAALTERAKESVSGTISVSFESDLAGSVRRRVKVTKLITTGADGESRTETVTETLERRLISRRR